MENEGMKANKFIAKEWKAKSKSKKQKGEIKGGGKGIESKGMKFKWMECKGTECKGREVKEGKERVLRQIIMLYYPRYLDDKDLLENQPNYGPQS